MGYIVEFILPWHLSPGQSVQELLEPHAGQASQRTPVLDENLVQATRNHKW